MPGVHRHRRFVEWTDAIVDPESDAFLGYESRAICEGIEDLIDDLQASDGPLAMPRGKQLIGTRFDLYELRWPPLPRGSGPRAMFGGAAIRILYGYVRPVCSPSIPDAAVILLGGNKSPTVDRWYDVAVPEAERRLADWCDEHLAFVPRESEE